MATKPVAMAVVSISGVSVMLPLDQAMAAFAAMQGGKMVTEKYGEGAPYTYVSDSMYNRVSIKHVTEGDLAKMALDA